jgi:UDP-N-acetylglucosamine/UDP-N-acetylgalactosamine diphosphorylase
MITDVKNKLKKYNQEHLLRFYDELDEDSKKGLLKQIDSIDFDLMVDLYNNINKKSFEKDITAMPSFTTNDEYVKAGIKCMKNGEYAIITLAGGQGTRLGFDGPKGTYTLGYGINKTLFEIQCDKLKKIYQECGTYTPWYIMTSYENNDDTIAFFKQNNYLNYPKEKIHFFIQEELPMIDINGKILMDTKSNIKMGPNGHGGIFSALYKNDMIEVMKKDNTKWIFVTGIDNVLSPIEAYDLIGFAKKGDFLGVSYTIQKAYPEEKVGVFCKINDKASVIEYTEMTPEMNNLRDDDGHLVYGDAHILLNLFNIEVFDMIAKRPLKYVPAFKKANYINENGELIIPEKENAYKFETFIFGAFPYLDSVGLLKGTREEIFAPIKNATGIDSPESASELYLNYYEKVK